MKDKYLHTIEEFKDAFVYDPKTGGIYRIGFDNMDRQKLIRVGANGYVTLDGIKYKVIRVGWALTHGHWPSGPLYRYDGNPKNNKLENLQLGRPVGRYGRKSHEKK